MDSALAKVIGPWARIIDPNLVKNSSTAGNFNNKSQAVKNFTGFSTTYNDIKIKSISQLEQGNQQQQQPRIREKIEVNFSQLHKKQSSKFIRGVESRRDFRATELNRNRKLRRSELLMARRPELLRAVSPIIDEESFKSEGFPVPVIKMDSKPPTRSGGPMTNNPVLKQTELQNCSKSVNNKTAVVSKPGAAVVSFEAMKTTDQRRMQLLEYKKTKMELAKSKEENKLRPFKPGGVVASHPAITKTTAIASAVTNRNKLVSAVDKVPNVNRAAKVGNANSKEESERRVTRAMAKGVVAKTDRPNPSAMLKPTIKELKNLNINSKLPLGNTNSKLENKFVPKQILENQQNIEPVLSPEVPAVQLMSHPPAPVKVVKAKPKEIDGVYADYNFRFATACGSLTKTVSCWESIQKLNTDIPDAVVEDIDAAIGQAKLLLRSKLPQFAELLWQYISPPTDADTPAVLDCDLEGWWAVASIQVDKVLDAFKHLEYLQENDWSEKETKPIVAKTSMKSLKSNKPKKLKESLAPAKSNFKLFLLNKNAAKVESESTDIKLFDAGLFQIQSPASPAPTQGTPKTRQSMRRSGLVQNGQTLMNTPTENGSMQRTPASQRRLSLVQMSVKRSMGLLYRVGVIPEQQNDVNA